MSLEVLPNDPTAIKRVVMQMWVMCFAHRMCLVLEQNPGGSCTERLQLCIVLFPPFQIYMELEQGKNVDFWRDMTIITEDEIAKLRKLEASGKGPGKWLMGMLSWRRTFTPFSFCQRRLRPRLGGDGLQTCVGGALRKRD